MTPHPDNHIDRKRRKLIMGLMGGSVLGPGVIPQMIRVALAMGKRDYPQGMQTVTGDVKVNGKSAVVGTLVDVGDVVTTGKDGYAVFVLKKSVYLLRENSELEISLEYEDKLKEKSILILQIISGSLLSVFGKGKKQMVTSTAVIGVRGTAVYLESDPEKTYICTCYGRADLSSRVSKDYRETVKTRHHEQPRYIFGRGAKELVTRAPVINHTDSELILLESMVGRRPPFLNTTKGASRYDQ